MNAPDQREAFIARLRAARLSWLAVLGLIALSVFAALHGPTANAGDTVVSLFGWELERGLLFLLDETVLAVLLLVYIIHVEELHRMARITRSAHIAWAVERVPWVMTSCNGRWWKVPAILILAAPGAGIYFTTASVVDGNGSPIGVVMPQPFAIVVFLVNMGGYIAVSVRMWMFRRHYFHYLSWMSKKHKILTEPRIHPPED